MGKRKETRDRTNSADMTAKHKADMKTRCVRIQARTWRRLQALAEPFTDTPGRVIARLLDEHDSHGQQTKESDNGQGQKQDQR